MATKTMTNAKKSSDIVNILELGQEGDDQRVLYLRPTVLLEDGSTAEFRMTVEAAAKMHAILDRARKDLKWKKPNNGIAVIQPRKAGRN
jgi:hypothetical protein